VEPCWTAAFFGQSAAAAGGAAEGAVAAFGARALEDPLETIEAERGRGRGLEEVLSTALEADSST